MDDIRVIQLMLGVIAVWLFACMLYLAAIFGTLRGLRKHIERMENGQ